MPRFGGGPIVSSGGGGTSFLHPGTLDATFAQGESEEFGTVTGLPATPARIVGFHAFEPGRGIAQDGYTYAFTVYQLNSNGFLWRLSLNADTFWPGPGTLLVRVNYLWSET